MGTGYNMVTVNWLKSHLTTDDEIRAYARDLSMLIATDAVVNAMDQANLSKADVAERTGWTRSMVSQTLSGSRNMTLKTLAEMLWACGLELSGLLTRPLGQSTVDADKVNHWLDEDICLPSAEASHELASAAPGEELELQVELSNSERTEVAA